MKRTRHLRPLRPISDKCLKATRLKGLLRLTAIFTFAVLLVLKTFLIPAFAFSINVDPSSIKITLKQGESKSGEIAVQNTGSNSIRIKTYTEDWIYAADGSKTFMKPGSSVYSCSNWIKLDPVEFSLLPKEERKIGFVITAPKTASGSHVSVIFFESLINQTKEIAVSGRLGVIIYQDTEGDINRSGEIKEMSVITSKEGIPVKVNISFINKGNSYISVKPHIKIMRDNKTVFESDAMSINTLPGNEGSSSIAILQPLKAGNYKVQAELNFDNKTLKSQSDLSIK